MLNSFGTSQHIMTSTHEITLEPDSRSPLKKEVRLSSSRV